MEFFSPAYNHALSTAIVYGLKVLLGMIVVSGCLTFFSGGPAARGWKKQPH